MFKMLLYVIFSLAFCSLLYFASALIYFNSPRSMSKMTPFECGFDPKDSGRIPFSIRFFLLAVIFLIFDIEVVLLIPLVMMTQMKINCVIIGYAFGMLLVLGLFHEWKMGALSWIY
uniref:NADH-ubiquinone oxidoreductase chain 3 n=1 Tax=Membranipora grandicella TaxID=192923 RepID=I6M191_9BILA|nr:NADH dehydrogenase subunit 3 [Membranipora grandicella]AEH99600.1 NADH dehydrogenase subunit 3 [Membranipora grandicella]